MKKSDQGCEGTADTKYWKFLRIRHTNDLLNERSLHNTRINQPKRDICR
jgi:hypothetical protein